ncbi:cyclin-dependent kinase-like 2 isoform X4 [Brachionus plicatilis]|uniref:cyclin-dependent kinase n=1 Tax=Brachionus plicatilis TaxID=10195 RepID=A0A3M7PAV4_BRAPC|nr:cyclin-dependent kinase-like 2 isoform X4 [Brachionus plicatilis]
MEKYENLGTVGEGSYGVVIKCKDKTNGSVVAIKKFLESENDRAVKKIAFREIKILKSLRHENLVNLIEVFRRNRKIYLVFEYIDQNLLEEIEKTKNGLGEEKTREIMYQVVRGVDFMHSNNIIHRDIKPENVLINNNGLIKVCDFGFARQIAQPSEIYTDYVATRWYRSPELLVGDPRYGKPVDVWSIGVLTYEVLTSRPLYPGESDLDQLFLIMNSVGDITDSMKQCFNKNQFYMNSKLPKINNYSPLQNKLKKFSPSLSKFIIDSLIIDPHKRYTSAELLQHDFFTENRWMDDFLVKLKKLVNQHETSHSSNRNLIVQSVLGKGDSESLKNVLSEPKVKEVQLQPDRNQNNTVLGLKTNSSNSNQAKTSSGMNNFFNSQQSDETKKTTQANISQSNNHNNSQKVLNQKFIKNAFIKPNFLIQNGKENANSDYYTTSFTSTVVNSSIKKMNTKKNVNTSKDNVVIEIKNSKILPKIENQPPTQPSDSPRTDIQAISSKHQTNNQTNTAYSSISYNLYKQQTPFSTTIANTNQPHLTSFSNLSMRRSPVNENLLTNSSLSILNEINYSNLKRCNSNTTIVLNNSTASTNQSQTQKSNNYFIDENIKLNKKPNILTSSNSDLNTSNNKSNRQENVKNNVRLPQMKSLDKKKYSFKY